MTRWDRYLVIFLLILVGLGFGFSQIPGVTSDAVKAVIKVDGRDKQEIILQKSLPEQRIFLADKCVIEAKGERIRVLKSGCPDKICVKTGWAKKPGQTIICIPQRVVISLENVKENKAEYDSVVY